MAIIRSKEIREFDDNELYERLGEIRLELAKDMGQIKIGGAPKNPGRVGELRSAVARLLTEQNFRIKKANGGRSA